MIYVIARAKLKEGMKEEYIRICKENIPNVLAEAGCIMYNLATDCEGPDADPDCATFVEAWESLDHLKAHLATPHMAAFREKVGHMRISTTLLKMESI